MQRAWIISFTLLTAGLSSQAPCHGAQDPAVAVTAAVQKVFDAMATKDTDALIKAFLPDARLVSIQPDGKVASTAASEWNARIGTIPETLLERMWSPKVMVDGRMATLWAPYDFHRGGKFSHCGVDSVTLVQVEGEWKLASIAYTIKREGCEPSPLGPPKQ